MTSDRKDLDFARGNRKPRPEDVLHLAEQRAGMTASEVCAAVRPVQPPCFSQLFTVQNCVDMIEHWRRQLAVMPNEQVLMEIAATATRALSTISPSAVTREVALLVAAFPNAAPTSPEIFISTLSYDLVDLRIPDAIVAEACRKLRRTSKFVPSISEVVAEAEQLLDQWRLVETLPERAAKARGQLEANIRQAQAQLTRFNSESLSPEFSAEPAETKPQPEKARTPVRFPTLAAAWKDDPEMLDLLGRCDFDLQIILSGLLATKGEFAAREMLKRKMGAA